MNRIVRFAIAEEVKNRDKNIPIIGLEIPFLLIGRCFQYSYNYLILVVALCFHLLMWLFVNALSLPCGYWARWTEEYSSVPFWPIIYGTKINLWVLFITTLIMYYICSLGWLLSVGIGLCVTLCIPILFHIAFTEIDLK